VEKFIEEPITKKEIILGYYPSFIIFIDGMLWPLFALIAVIFFTSRMAYNSEIISIFNAGISFKRLMRPYLIGASIVAIIHMIGSHYYIPKGNKVRLEITYKYLSKNDDKGKTRNVHMFLSPDTKIYIQYYRKADSLARDFRLEQFKDGRLTHLLKAQTAQWAGPPDKWKLNNYEIRSFDDMHESLILGKGQTIDTSLNLTPQDFVDYKEQQSMMTTPELLRYINKQKARGVGNTTKYEIELHRRSSEPFTIFILTIIGMSIAARKVRGGMGLHLAVGIGLGAAFVFLTRFSMVFATGNTIPVMLGMWIPNIVFGLISIYLVIKAQK
jgi:lipopolysaccharide export system permease protein